MGLGDVYNNIPDSFSGQTSRQIGQAFQSAPGLYEQHLRSKAMEQSNADAAYNSPTRDATSHEQGIGEYIKRLTNGPEEFRRRFAQENGGATQGPQGMGAPGPQGPPPQGPPQGLQAQTYNGPMARPPEQMEPEIRGASRPPPEFAGHNPISQQADRDQFAARMRDTDDPYGSGMDGLSAGPSRASAGFATSQPERRPAPPPARMTRGDVDMYTKLHPFLESQRPRTGASGLTFEERKALENLKTDGRVTVEETKGGIRSGIEDQKGGIKGKLQDTKLTAEKENLIKVEARKAQADLWAHEDRLASIEARLKIGGNNAMAIAQFKGEIDIIKAGIAAKAKELSSDPNLANNPRLKEDLTVIEGRIKQAELNVEKMKASAPKEGSNTSSSFKMQETKQQRLERGARDWAMDPKNANDPRAILHRKKLGL
jgi:hypothetical protein